MTAIQTSDLITVSPFLSYIHQNDKWLLFNTLTQKSVQIDDSLVLLLCHLQVPQYYGFLREEWGYRCLGIPEGSCDISKFDACVSTLLSEGFIELFNIHKRGFVDDLIFPGSPDHPKLVALHVTNKCNQSCCYCYNFKHREAMSDSEFSVDHWASQMDMLFNLGVEIFDITGGEPLLRWDLLPVFSDLKQKGAQIRLITNGTLLTSNKKASELSNAVTHVYLSIDSHLSSVHDNSRGVSSHSKVVRAAQFLSDNDVKWTAKSVFHSANTGPISAVKEFVLSLGADSLDVSIISGDETTDLEASRTTYNILRQCRTASQLSSSNNIPECFKVKRGLPCTAARSECAIDHTGEVYPCRSLMFPELRCGSIFRTPFKHIWESAEPLLQFRSINYSSIAECKSCSVFRLCLGGCRAQAYTRCRSYYGFIGNHLCAQNKKRTCEYIQFHMNCALEDAAKTLSDVK